MKPRLGRTARCLARSGCIAAAFSVFTSCAYDTPLERVRFNVQVSGAMRDVSAPPTFTTPLGWTVTLTSAQVSIGPIYFYDGAPTAGTTTNQGIAVAQVRSVFTVDVLNPVPRLVAIGDGTNQMAGSAAVWLDEATEGPIADIAGSGTALAHVVGHAENASHAVVSFDGTLRLPMASSAYLQFVEHHVTQIPASLAASQGGTLTVNVDFAHWFDMVAFDQLCAMGSSQPCGFESASAANQLRTGIGSAAAFTFVFAP